MASILRDINGGMYSVLEPNFLAGRRTGQVKAQLPLDEDDFGTNNPAQNGMLLVYNSAAGAVELPDPITQTVMLHFSVEQEYNHITPGLNRFALTPDGFYPRLYQLHIGDVWTTDAVALTAPGASDAEVEAAYEALTPSATTQYSVGTDGFVNLTSGDTSGAVLVKVIAKTTLPNGEKAVKLEVSKAQ